MTPRAEGFIEQLHNRMTVLEALPLLVAARVALRLVPFRRLMALVSRPVRRAELQGADRLRARQAVRRGVFAARRYLPFSTTCLHRAIAVHWMLRRRGVGTTLYYGVNRGEGEKLGAHAWVQDGEVGVVGLGATRKQRFHIVARYPEME